MASEVLPLRVKLFYSAGAVSGNALSQAFALWLIFFYAPPDDEQGVVTRVPAVGLPDLDFGVFAFPEEITPRVVLGLVMTIARLAESLDDPIVGYWTDRTNSRWGRRIPYILFATPWWALLFCLLFFPPIGGESMSNVLWLVIVLEGYWLASNFSGAPLEALLPHLAKTHDDRVTVASLQMMFGVGGAVVGLSISSLLVEVVGFAGMAVVVAGIAFAARYAALFGCWEYARTDAKPSTPGFKLSLRQTFANQHFVAFLPSFVTFRLGQLMLTALLPFYVSEVLGEVEVFGFNGKDDGGLFTFALTALVISGVLAGIAIFAPLARHAGKAKAFRIALLWGAGALGVFFFAGFLPGVPKLGQAVVAVFCAGLPLAGVFMLPNILIADIVDHDASRNYTRREGIFYGTQNLLEKSASAFAPLLFALVLLLGDSAENPLGIRLVGPIAGLLVLGGYLSFRKYTLDEAESN